MSVHAPSRLGAAGGVAVALRENGRVAPHRRPTRALERTFWTWGWIGALVVSFVLYEGARSSSHVAEVVIGGQPVSNAATVLAEASQATYADQSGYYALPGAVQCFFLPSASSATAACEGVDALGFGVGNWTEFRLVTTKLGGGVAARLGRGGPTLEELPLGARLIAANGDVSVVTSDQTAGSYMTDSSAEGRSAMLMLLGVVWALVAAIVSTVRRGRKRAADAAAETRRDADRRRATSWEGVGALVGAPPVRPPRPVLVAAASAVTRAPADASPQLQLELAGGLELQRSEVGQGSSATPQPERLAGPPDDAAQVHHWSGPAVLLLGPVEVVGWSQQPDRHIVTELAAYLACHQDRPRSAEEIHAAVWPMTDAKADVVLDTVRQHLSRLRRALGEGHLPDAGKAGGYRLASTVSSDWFRFQALVEAARRTEREASIGLWRQALGLVRGKAFEGVASGTYGWAWNELLISEMETAIIDVAHQLAQASLPAAPRMADWAAGRGLLAVATDETLWGDRYEAALAIGGRARLQRVHREANAVLGEQADNGPLAALYSRLSTSEERP